MRDKGQATTNEQAAEEREREARLQQMRALESLKRLGRQRSNDSGELSKTIAEEHRQMKLYKHFSMPNSFLSSCTTCKHLVLRENTNEMGGGAQITL